AATELSPNQINTGKEIKVPPPATEFIAPARKAAPKAVIACKGSNVQLILSRFFLMRGIALCVHTHSYGRSNSHTPGPHDAPRAAGHFVGADRRHHENRGPLSRDY